MSNNLFFETFLYVSKKKFIIYSSHFDKLEKIYKYEKFIENNSSDLDLEQLKEFLDNNILKLEKKIDKFIKNIYVVIDTKNFFNIKLSVKNYNNGNILTPGCLSYSLNEARDQCKKTLENKKIIHMLIDNYRVNNKNYSFLPKNLKCHKYSLDVRFICLSNNLIKELENCLEKYQISINKIICAEYVTSYFENNRDDFFKKTKKITDGCNSNEVEFHNKISRNVGFFEKFFNFFR